MRSGYKVTLGILTIMILVTMTIGTSYSYYSVAKTQEDPNVLTSTCFDISYTEGTNGSIKLDATYPMSDEDAISKITPYEFTITNTCTTENATDPVNYEITLNTLLNPASTLPLNLVKYRLDQTTPSATTGTSTLVSNANQYNLDATIKSENGIDASYELASGTLNPGESKTFNLYLWIDESATGDVMNQTFTGRVLVYSHM